MRISDWSSDVCSSDLLVMIDAAAKLGERAERVLQGIEGRPEKKFLVLNKVDLTRKDKLLTTATTLNERVAFDETFFITASTSDGVLELKAALSALMREGHWHFPDAEVSASPEGMLAAATKHVPP